MGLRPIPHDLENRTAKRALGFARDMRKAKGSALLWRCAAWAQKRANMLSAVPASLPLFPGGARIRFYPLLIIRGKGVWGEAP